MKSTFTAIALVGTLVLSQLALGADGEKHSEKWKKDHPRQAEVNGRLQNQKNRIENGVKNGSLTQQQANTINKQDNKIYKEEQGMKAQNGSNSITPGQQAKLNHQENAVSHEIKADKAANTAVPGSTAPPATAPAPSN